MNPIKTCAYLTLSRERVFDAVRALPPADFTRQFEIGRGRIDCTLTHIMLCEGRYVQRMQRRDVPPYAECLAEEHDPPTISELETRWRTQADITRSVIEATRDWNVDFEFTSGVDPARGPITVSASAMDIFTQLVLHEVHHRAQVMAMLRQLGKPVQGEIDFNALMYKRRPAE